MVVSINIVAILTISEKLVYLRLLKINVFKNKVYDIIIPVHDVTNKPCDTNYIVNVVMWPKFDSCSISMREVI